MEDAEQMEQDDDEDRHSREPKDYVAKHGYLR